METRGGLDNKYRREVKQAAGYMLSQKANIWIPSHDFYLNLVELLSPLNEQRGKWSFPAPFTKTIRLFPLDFQDL